MISVDEREYQYGIDLAHNGGLVTFYQHLGTVYVDQVVEDDEEYARDCD